MNAADAARLHVAALLSPDIKFERIFAFAAPHNWKEVIEILRKLRPDNSLIPPAPENPRRDLSDVIPSRRAEEILQRFFNRSGWVGLEESISEGISGVE